MNIAVFAPKSILFYIELDGVSDGFYDLMMNKILALVY
jgi:hypothetical protein